MLKTNSIEKKKTGPIDKQHRKFVFEELSQLIETGEIIGFTQTQLAGNYKLGRQTIGRYLKKIYGSIPPEDINHTRVKIQVLFDKLFREAQLLIADSLDNKDKKEAISIMLSTIDKYTEFLENFHLKDKATEKLVLGVEKQLVLIRDESFLQIEGQRPPPNGRGL